MLKNIYINIKNICKIYIYVYICIYIYMYIYKLCKRKSYIFFYTLKLE